MELIQKLRLESEIKLCILNDAIFRKNKYYLKLRNTIAFLLSSDLATLFGGRFFEIKVFPLKSLLHI